MLSHTHTEGPWDPEGSETMSKRVGTDPQLFVLSSAPVISRPTASLNVYEVPRQPYGMMTATSGGKQSIPYIK